MFNVNSDILNVTFGLNAIFCTRYWIAFSKKQTMIRVYCIKASYFSVDAFRD
jgi:hypothetical protein